MRLNNKNSDTQNHVFIVLPNASNVKFFLSGIYNFSRMRDFYLHKQTAQLRAEDSTALSGPYNI